MPTAAINVAPVLLGATETTIGTVPASTEWNVATIRFCNTDSTNHTVTIYNYDSGGGSAADLTTEYKELLIQAKSTFEYGPLSLPAARRISALADVGSKVSARIHGWATT